MSDQNEKFLAAIRKIGNHPTGYRMALLHMSDLPPAKRTRDNLTRAIKDLAQLRAKYNEGEIFVLSSLDIVFVGHVVTRPVLAGVCEDIQVAFLGRGALGIPIPGAGARTNFFTIFELSRDYSKAVAYAEAAQAPVQQQMVGGRAVADSTLLARIKEEILHTDIAAMLFNQPAYDIGSGPNAQVMFHETYISVQVLEQIFCPGISITGRRWLFADLTEELDTVVLRFLADPRERQGRHEISLNINLSTLASEKFAKFDAEITPEYRGEIILEVNKTDVFENMGLFRRVTPGLREKGYRILLDSLSFDSLVAIDFDGLPCDFAKVFWDNEFNGLPESEVERAREKMRTGKPRFILARCDNAESVRFARSAGVTIVQGRLIDHMMRNKGGL